MMQWLRKVLAGRNGGVGRPCCGDYENCQRACVPRGEYRASRHADNALAALHMLYTETADYIERNHLGPVHHNQSMRMARDALAAAGMTIWYEKPKGGLGDAIRKARGGDAPPPPPRRFA